MEKEDNIQDNEYKDKEDDFIDYKIKVHINYIKSMRKYTIDVIESFLEI